MNSGPMVYVVDDEPSNVATLAAVLRINGFSTESFTNPLEAIEAAQAIPPDILISDVMMPELPGFRLATQLKEICPDCKIVLLSGHPAAGHMAGQEHPSGHNFQILAKPMHPLDLLAELRR